MTGIITLSGNLVEKATHKVHVLVAGAGSKHASMVTIFVNIVPPLKNMKHPPNLVVPVRPEEIPKVVKDWTKPQNNRAWKIVYGNKKTYLMSQYVFLRSNYVFYLVNTKYMYFLIVFYEL